MQNRRENLEIAGYTLLSSRSIPEFRSQGLLFRHDATGCEIYQLLNADEERLFAFLFRTPPRDGTGVAHILEHTVLCGSKRFPVKDPFLHLLKGSMHSFLNAMTYPDKTVYPAASVVEKDYFNLMKVYGDAVFFPLLKKEAFLQEGWRLERTGANYSATGIVFNEMKGNYSEADSIAAEHTIRPLFPQTPYRFDSGGDPDEIVNLTFEDFLAFHRSYYHPSNCRIFLYGDVDPEKNLRFLDEQFLSRFSKIEIDSAIPEQRPWQEPRFVEATLPLSEGDDPEGRTMLLLNWMLGSTPEPELLLASEVLGEILIGHAGSPLTQALIESRLGEDLAPVSGIETELRQLVFTVGLRGSEAERLEAFRDLVFKTLQGLVENGIPDDIREGALRTVEFRNREVRRGGPYGLRLLHRLGRGWLHGFHPETTLLFAPVLEGLRDTLRSEPRYLENLIREKFLENPHRADVVLRPDRSHLERSEARHASWLEKRVAGLGAAELAALAADQEAVKRFHETPDDPDEIRHLPFLKMEDVPRTVESLPSSRSDLGPGRILTIHRLFANKIVYLDLVFDLGGLEPRLMPLLPLFTRLVTGGGVEGLSYDEVARRMSLVAGGFSAWPESGLKIDGRPFRAVFVSLKTLSGQLPEALALLGRILTTLDSSDETRVKDLILELRNDMKSAVIPSGSAFATTRAASLFSATLKDDEVWRGLSQVESIDAIASGPLPVDELRTLARTIFTRSGLSVNVTTDQELADEATRTVLEWVGTLAPGETVAPAGNDAAFFYPSAPIWEGFILPARVGFTGVAFPGASFDKAESTHEHLLAHLLRTGTLWEKVRMEGGAYGVSAYSGSMAKIFQMSSYRDPAVGKTVAVFADALGAAERTDFDALERERAVIGVVGKEIQPQSPGSKGLLGFRRILYGVTDALRQIKRDELLAVSTNDLRRAAGRLRKSLLESGSYVVLSDEESLVRMEETRPLLKGKIKKISV